MINAYSGFTVQCDRCQRYLSSGDSEFDHEVFPTREDAENRASDHDWEEGLDGKLLCGACLETDRAFSEFTEGP